VVVGLSDFEATILKLFVRQPRRSEKKSKHAMMLFLHGPDVACTWEWTKEGGFSQLTNPFSS
jgi:hypothetical protein